MDTRSCVGARVARSAACTRVPGSPGMVRTTGRFGGLGATAAPGRLKPVDFDVAMSGEGSTAAVGRVQFNARTRPTPVTDTTQERTVVSRVVCYAWNSVGISERSTEVVRGPYRSMSCYGKWLRRVTLVACPIDVAMRNRPQIRRLQ